MWIIKSDKSFIIRLLKTLLKFGTAALVVYFVFRGDTGKIGRVLHKFNILWLIPAVLFNIFPTLVSAWRWQSLARIQGINLRFAEAYSLTMQGYFFSLVIPGGAIGGDVVKMGAISCRLPEGRKMTGVFSVLMDRIVGMIALFALTLLLIFPVREIFFHLEIPGIPEKSTGVVIFWLLSGICIAGICTGIALFLYRKLENLPLVNTLCGAADKWTKGAFSRLLKSADIYRSSKKKVFMLTAVSMTAIHIFSALPIVFLLAGCGSDFNALIALTAITVGNIAGLIPLFPGGIGSRDMASVALLTAGGVAGSHADAAQILYTALMVLTYLAGGLFFVFDPARKLHCCEVNK